MATEDPNALETIIRFAEAYLKRPLTLVERQVLEAFVRNKPMDLSQASQQTVDQARQRAGQVLQDDERRTRQILEQISGANAGSRNDPQAQELVLQQLLAAAGALSPVQASPPPSGPSPASPAPAPVSADDPVLKAMISTLVQQEVKAAVEARMSELSQKVEDTLKQVTQNTGSEQ